MTRTVLVNLLVAVAMTVVIGLVAGPAWPGFLLGAVLALSLAVGIWAGSAAVGDGIGLRPSAYAVGAVVAVALGALIGGTETNAFWAVGTVIAIAVAPASDKGVRHVRASAKSDATT